MNDATAAAPLSPWPSSVLVTGGAGFIGSNVVRRVASAGSRVTILDTMVRPYAAGNAARLQKEFPGLVHVVHGDVGDPSVVSKALGDAGAVVHLAGQTAVTRSVLDPRGDFADNAYGTLNVLEAARLSPTQPIVLYASTNKVYGNLDRVDIIEEDDRYRFASLPNGVSEDHPLDFASPYACSKGAGEQYVRDYARTYGLPTVVFRQSCVYGPHQLGAEDQGWLAWFLVAARAGRPITIYGNGKQVRDLLFVEDLVDGYEAALAAIETTSGQIYNIGGGVEHSVSIWWQLRPMLERALGHELPEATFGPWRIGDQRIFCADTSKARRDFGWSPTTTPSTGLMATVAWFDGRAPDPDPT